MRVSLLTTEKERNCREKLNEIRNFSHIKNSLKPAELDKKQKKYRPRAWRSASFPNCGAACARDTMTGFESGSTMRPGATHKTSLDWKVATMKSTLASQTVLKWEAP